MTNTVWRQWAGEDTLQRESLRTANNKLCALFLYAILHFISLDHSWLLNCNCGRRCHGYRALLPSTKYGVFVRGFRKFQSTFSFLILIRSEHNNRKSFHVSFLKAFLSYLESCTVLRISLSGVVFPGFWLWTWIHHYSYSSWHCPCSY